MTNATKSLTILFAASVLLAVVVRWGSTSTSSAAFRTQLLAVDTAQVQAVRIERSDGPSLRLRKSDGGWSVAPTDASDGFPASTATVESVLGTLRDIEVSAVATRQTEKHARYGVDSTGTRIAMLGADDNVLGELIVGRTQMKQPPSSGRRQNPMQRRRQRGTPVTYVRSPDKPDVYSVEQALTSIVNRDLESWRDKQIWTVDQSQINRVEFKYPADSSFTMRRVADSTASAWLSQGDTLSTNEVSSFLRTMANPTADGFAEDMTPDDVSDPQYAVHLQVGESSYVLRFYGTDDSNTYYATASDYPYVTEMRASRWDRSVLKGRAEFLSEQ